MSIIAIHQRGAGFSDVLVNHLPYSDQGKINWWLKNKTDLKELYDIPRPEPDGWYVVNFWLFHDGYKEDDGYDRLCFDDIKTKAHCIDKDRVFSVQWSQNQGTELTVHDGYYLYDKNGRLRKFKFEPL
ncbi:Enterobacterial putative membrane protein (DUF943) [Frateuria aurantia DSM 6220]|uniref:Enterobacterial putative membrane protein (DUF943) n=1 Tax=Frateuria aurantia (strain ATCC 33424 / DSM 6220 / KCTC 2777 / LMG 1558 / NBRC 3245 / NCIMB 13370) TaxID=767434 RepID=H8L6S3_FRAAD|nr:DUF943 family protein [Frateuria aurantia]AFC86009.1 Enterobacterial putative membrane protein (DUF943) [Frateuria aurantia DSM 6220]